MGIAVFAAGDELRRSFNQIALGLGWPVFVRVHISIIKESYFAGECDGAGGGGPALGAVVASGLVHRTDQLCSRKKMYAMRP